MNIVILLIIVAVVAILSVQNSAPVALTFFFWKFETPLSAVIFFSLMTGVIITAILAFSGYLKRIMKRKKQQAVEDVRFNKIGKEVKGDVMREKP